MFLTLYLFIYLFNFFLIVEKILETRDASPAHFLTKIESFSLFSHYGIDKYETREFEAGDYKWRLIIYPNGDEYENKEYISVYLAVAESSSLPVDWEINAIFTIFIYNQILNKYQFLRGNIYFLLFPIINNC
ncbi:PREDICTED: MATH domain and coiled-coil domain-containing protein At1g31390-like [Erythranthe guttata]|uniref:MATH domain and coiled-coil domain-containing protein At1g31390-like n=1 Tax=Erythranthe guttata TaxID=4155 RepID=UPI00064D7E4F|nr:PREDICTED: MATH domain and coiled-coil domain-containing protein At1g31390-like [Erythranthe guttata]|eukprot:XP_012847542.1 PREDICTED: MATH domain and coiled-coil domain-containing protein At1g31390-like [Erythranthe guttata]